MMSGLAGDGPHDGTLLSRLARPGDADPGPGAAPLAVAGRAAELLALRAGSDAPAHAFFVPGRVEVLGKHTDYGGGRSLLAAVDRGFTLVSVPREDGRVRIREGGGDLVEFPLDRDLEPHAGWSNYPMTVARRLMRDFPGTAAGADIALASDLPPASGMSSSSALIIGVFLCLASARNLAADDRFRRALQDGDALASYLAAVESGQPFGDLAGDSGVGTHGGSEDHTAILRAMPDHLLRYSFVPARAEGLVPMPAGYRFVIAVSGIHAEKAGAMRERYNRSAELVRTLVDLWNRETGSAAPSLAAAAASAHGASDRLREIAARAGAGSHQPDALVTRLEHFLRESEGIVPGAAAALAAGDLDRFGQLTDESQQLAESLLGNQIPQTSALVRLAREAGAVAASAFGAGYGGSVWALAREEEVDDLMTRWRRGYEEAWPGPAREATFFSTPAAGPARRIA